MFAITVMMFIAFVVGTVISIADMVQEYTGWQPKYIEEIIVTIEYPSLDSFPMPVEEIHIFTEETCELLITPMPHEWPSTHPVAMVVYEESELFPVPLENTAELLLPMGWARLPVPPATAVVEWDQSDLMPMPMDAAILARHREFGQPAESTTPV